MKSLLRSAAPAAMVALLMTGASGLSAANAEAPPRSSGEMLRATTLNLSAYGEVKAAPDMASISFGVITEAPTADAAMAQNRARMTQVIAALRRGGIAERDIQTSGLNLSPQYAYVQNEQPKLSGYQASNQVTVIVNDLARVGSAIDAVVAAGANNVGGVTFGLKDPTAAENDARRAAVRAMQAKAALYAQATGYSVGRLITLAEGGGYNPAPPPILMATMARAEKMDSTPVQPGQMNVRVDITALYELTR